MEYCPGLLWLSMTLDMDNLHFSEEFLKFPVWVDTDICADALGFSARYRTDFPHDTVRIFRAIPRQNLDRNSTWICAENGESHLCREVACEAEPVLLWLQRYT